MYYIVLIHNWLRVIVARDTKRCKRSKKRKHQRTMFAGPSDVRQKLVDKNNRVHLVPIDKSALGVSGEDILHNELIQCGK